MVLESIESKVLFDQKYNRIMEKKYFVEIDVFKGISILLIILLHSQCEFPIDLRGAEELHYIRSSIRLLSPNALFFYASGFLFFYSLRQNMKVFLSKKATRLLIPMVAFGFVAYVEKRMGSNFVHTPTEEGFFDWLTGAFLGKRYWFLYSLFLMFLLNKLFGKYQWLLALSSVLVSIFFVTDDMDTIQKTIYYNLFFFVGSKIGAWSKYEKISSYVISERIPMVFSSLFLLVISVVLVDLYYDERSLTCIYLQHFLYPWIAFGCLWILSISIGKASLLIFFGKYSLQYYLNHLLIILVSFYGAAFIFKYVHSYWLADVFVLLFTIAISTFMLYIENLLARKNKVFKLVFGL